MPYFYNLLWYLIYNCHLYIFSSNWMYSPCLAMHVSGGSPGWCVALVTILAKSSCTAQSWYCWPNASNRLSRMIKIPQCRVQCSRLYTLTTNRSGHDFEQKTPSVFQSGLVEWFYYSVEQILNDKTYVHTMLTRLKCRPINPDSLTCSPC